MSIRFGIDMDGVLANFTAMAIEAANSIWPGKIPQGYVPDTWDYDGVLTKEEWAQVWTKIKATPYFWVNLPALPGALQLLNGLTKEDEPYFITARAKTIGDSPLAQSSFWLHIQHLWPRFGFSTVIPVADAKHKKDLFRGLGLKYMLDDYAPTVKELNEIEGVKAFLLDAPYNRHMILPRVYSVTEYLSIIRSDE